MAKKIKEDVGVEVESTKKKKASIKEAFDLLAKLNPEAKYLNDNSLSNVTEWIDTGCMVLNAIISGSLYGGVPMGRLTGFIGPESCGKTLMVNKIAANAQKKGMYIAYFDTEGALDEATAERLGCDPKRIQHNPIKITEKCGHDIVKFFEKLCELGLQGKALVIIDSVGNLITTQEEEKINKGVLTPDMGNRAKSLKSMMRSITHAASKANCPVVFTNHIYDDPSQLHKSALKKQAGGSGPLYMSSVIVQMAKKTERTEESDNKDANKEETVMAKGINGLTLRALTTKNRFVPPFLECEMYLNFRTGLSKYTGLLEMAVGFDIIQKAGHQYAIDGNTIGYYKNWRDDDEIWGLILPKLEEKLKSELAFRNETTSLTISSEEDEEDDLEETDEE